jgi:hypothetical protein
MALCGGRGTKTERGWSKNITAYLDRVAARPKVQEAMKAEGLLQ